ncbi:HNH endonuclease [Gracilimonas mengyeensis]|uniref:Putative restriction endonuclease n=1 Tax=Gracilimonas mengyeensis TaxID=1302730 RepID=A0A521CI70_9BACT|nr:HNH endonuclease [Gracilimonas mengyeensis]SMO59055.1 putative restriction endonuclease [Gracilimonas mengyeensis]
MNPEIINWLKNLNTDKSNPWPNEVTNQAPHKPFLLLSVIDGIEQGWIENNYIELSSELSGAFYRYWDEIMGDRNTKISIPFNHLDGEPFWTTNKKNAFLDDKLFDLLKQEKHRDHVRGILLRKYFDNETAAKLIGIGEMSGDIWEKSKELSEMVQNEFVAMHSSKGKTKTSIVERQKRGQSFSLSVKNQYRYHCAVCRSKVITPGGKVIVDGAHIIPWEVSYNDDPRNGISLCKNHHWMFDEHLYTVRPDYTILMSPILSEKGQKMDIANIANTKILLPANESYIPAEEALLYHNRKFEEFHNSL